VPDPVIPLRVAYELPVDQLVAGLYFLRIQVPVGYDLEADPKPVSLSWTPTDSDGDGIPRELDNCPDTFNPNQSDFDGDIIGDACDSDIDGDGVLNDIDACPSTSADNLVDLTGCSIAQLCPCDGPQESTQSWRNHGKYVKCVKSTSRGFVKDGLLSKTEQHKITEAAAKSNCGRSADSDSGSDSDSNSDDSDYKRDRKRYKKHG